VRFQVLTAASMIQRIVASLKYTDVSDMHTASTIKPIALS
jgi:hypothetical protein